MCSQKTGSACGTSGSRELCRGGVPYKRAARLQAVGFGTIDVSVSSAESGTRHHIANAVERTGREAHAVRVSAADGDAGARRGAGQSQARVSAVPRRRIGDEGSTAASEPLEWRDSEARGEPAERTLVDGFRDGLREQRDGDSDVDHRGRLHAGMSGDRGRYLAGRTPSASSAGSDGG